MVTVVALRSASLMSCGSVAVLAVVPVFVVLSVLAVAAPPAARTKAPAAKAAVVTVRIVMCSWLRPWVVDLAPDGRNVASRAASVGCSADDSLRGLRAHARRSEDSHDVGIGLSAKTGLRADGTAPRRWPLSWRQARPCPTGRLPCRGARAGAPRGSTRRRAVGCRASGAPIRAA